MASVKKDSAGRGMYTTPMSTKRAATALYPFLNEFEYEDNLLAANRKGKGAESTEGNFFSNLKIYSYSYQEVLCP